MEDCIFCKIAAGEIPAFKIYEDDLCVATLDIGPASEGHTLIIPKKHYRDLTEMDEALLGSLFTVAKKIGTRQMARLGADGFNVVQNNGTAAGQTVMHFHMHVIPRYLNGPQMVTWEPEDPGMEALQAVYEKLK